MQGHGNAVHQAIAHCPVMGAGQVDTDGDALRAGVQCGSDRPETLRQDGTGTSMQQSVRLRVPCDRHATGNSSGNDLGDLDPHALHEGAWMRSIKEGPELINRECGRGLLSRLHLGHGATVGLGSGNRA